MSTETFPEELVDKIVESIGDDRATLIALSKVNMRWARLSRPYLLSSLVFEDEQDIIDFSVLIRAPYRTFPPSIRCKELALHNATTIGDETPTDVRNVLASITVENSLKIHVTDGRISKTVVEASRAWRNVTQLALSGEGHEARAVFHSLNSFTQLESLHLEDFSLMLAEEGAESTMQFSLPSTIIRLATIRSSGVWTFFFHRVIPSGGFPNIRCLRIEALFCFEEPGVWNMVEYLSSVRGIETLEFIALYDVNSRDLGRNMHNIFGTEQLTLMKRPGLRRLDLDFSKLPASFALDTLIMHATFVPYRAKNLSVAVNIRVPGSPALWDGCDPEGHLQLIFLQATPPTGTLASETTGRPTFTLLGFPGALPEDIRASGGARVCGYPVSIVEAPRPQVGKQCDVRGYLRGLVFSLWRRLKDYFAGLFA